MDGAQNVDVQVVEPGVEGFVLQVVAVRHEGGGHVMGGVFEVRLSLQVVADRENGLRLGQGVDQAGEQVAGVAGVAGDSPQALPVLRQVEVGLA